MVNMNNVKLETYASILNWVTVAVLGSASNGSSSKNLASDVTIPDEIARMWHAALSDSNIADTRNVVNIRSESCRHGHVTLASLATLIDANTPRALKRKRSIGSDGLNTESASASQSLSETNEQENSLPPDVIRMVEDLKTSSIFASQVPNPQEVDHVVKLIHRTQTVLNGSIQAQNNLYQLLGLHNANSAALCLISNAVLTVDVSPANGELFVKHVIAAKILQLTNAAGREILQLLHRACSQVSFQVIRVKWFNCLIGSQQHDAVVNGLLLNLLLDDSPKSKWVSQVLKRVLVEYIDRSKASETLNTLLSGKSAKGRTWSAHWNETDIGMIVALVNKRVPLDKHVLSTLVTALKQSMTCDDKTAKVLQASPQAAGLSFALTSRYAGMLGREELEQLEVCLKCSTSTMTKPALLAVQKLLAKATKT